MNNEITNVNEIKVGDDIVLEGEFSSDLMDGKIVSKDDNGILANVFDQAIPNYGIRKINPNQIISLRRGANYFKVSIKQ